MEIGVTSIVSFSIVLECFDIGQSHSLVVSKSVCKISAKSDKNWQFWKIYLDLNNVLHPALGKVIEPAYAIVSWIRNILVTPPPPTQACYNNFVISRDEINNSCLHPRHFHPYRPYFCFRSPTSETNIHLYQ